MDFINTDISLKCVKKKEQNSDNLINQTTTHCYKQYKIYIE